MPPPHEHAWQQVKGRRTAMALLSFLVSQPGCHATHDVLAQALRPGHAAALRSEEDEEEDHALQRVDNLVSDLRRLLFPPALASLPAEQQRAVRKAILRGVKASRDSGVSYVLASLPLVWLDVEMMEHHARQAMSHAQAGQRDLNEWRAVAELGLRGMFLPHETYSDWSTWRRARVRELLWQSIQAQITAFDQEPGQQTDEETVHLLVAYWQSEPINEDAFRVLAERLARSGRYQHIEEYYQQLLRALEREERVPHQRTIDVIQSIQRMATPHSMPDIRSILNGLTPAPEAPLAGFSSGNALKMLDGSEQISQEASPQISTCPEIYSFSHVATKAQLQREDAYAFLITALFSLVGDDVFMAQFSPAKRATLRRFLAATSVLFSGMSPLPPSWEQATTIPGEAMKQNPAILPHFEKVLREGWELSNINELEAANDIVASILPYILLDPTHIDPRTALLASQGLRLQSVLAAHQLQLQQKITLCEQAVEYARIARDNNALASALAELAVAFKYANQPRKMLHTYQQMLTYVDQGVSPLIQSRAYAASAAAFARTGRKREALFYIDLAYETFESRAANDPQELWADYGQHLLIFYHGSVYFDINDYQQAWDILEKGRHLDTIAERNRLEIVNLQARVAAHLCDLEHYVSTLDDALKSALTLKSRMRYNEAITTLKNDIPQSWWKEPSVKELVYRFQLKVG